ncbi:hypothetical protein [Phenylobacterium sp.]|uniref:hypothetical protein n=1 Tax=Phenylobacterium sp. TaxID=1871053 RepID=UPI0012110469|nr:hypothetical protein [Phenylobacterium sp.]THD67306.1 MAG: hypothetical protein E8A12_05170 [Phenylobacterium sp.]
MTSISALVISVCSIFIAVHNGHDADKALQAQTYPYLDQDRSDATPTGEKRLSIGFVNNGVGPAHEESFRVRLRDGRYARSLDDLIADAVGRGGDLKAIRKMLYPLTNTTPTRFIPANSSQFIFQMTRTDANARWWDPLDDASKTWRMEVCYCSVFHDCWTRVDTAPPEPAKACKRDEATEYDN